MRLVVVGSGAMGLAAAYHAAKAGHAVTVVEADDRPGGMAAHFDFQGLSIERFYHFICKADQPTFDLLAELGLAEALRWRPTRMGYFYRGRLHRWGDPFALMAFPHLDLVSKLRYGLHMAHSTKRGDWRSLDRLSAADWIKAWGGRRAWLVLWEKLFSLKFFEYADEVSAAWLWTRIKRVGTSRRSLLQEELGYIEGGSETLISRLADRLRALGGTIRLSCPAGEVTVADGAVTGVSAGGEHLPADAVIATVPTPFVPGLIPALPAAVKDQYAAIRNIGVVCVVHKLKRSVTENFWLNINDDRIDVPGIVEFSRLRDLGSTHVVYVPYYMPITHPKFGRPNEAFIRESFQYLTIINPALNADDLIGSHVGRLRHAQPVCGPGFLDRLPPVETPIRGLQVADTAFYYPEDRGIAESVRLGQVMAARLGTGGSGTDRTSGVAAAAVERVTA